MMEAVDPEGLSDTTWATITVLKNDPPHAEFTITKQVKKAANGTSETVYTFDASDSTDDYTASNNLRYRWDFNYTGSDDIVFDTQFSTSPKHTGTFSIPRQKVIRLQVIDQDAAMDETFQTINVER